tara:strand:- start:1794 stop:3011 length:1218 start_codon:yes stop_codon:yes gene_type:complete
MNQRRTNKRALFLIRAYNDLDHIAPVVWKMASAGSEVAYLLTGEDFSGDYRINLLHQVGARRLRSATIEVYDRKLRQKIRPTALRSLVDWILAVSFGCLLLKRCHVGCVAVEWGGAIGRARAPFFLRAARLMNLPTLSIPHGYHTWLDNDFNDVSRDTGLLPQFPDRNRYTRYVVQSENIKRYCEESGIRKEKLDVLGSARFCKEWSDLNRAMCVANNKQTAFRDGQNLVVLFFLNHWNYNVDRERCLNLLKAISEEKEVTLIIKGHTRGRESGALSVSEEKSLDRFGNVVYPDDELHSPYLIEQSDVVIVYGSSICFEALRQGRMVIWPRFVCSNRTIFNEGEIVTHAEDECTVIKKIRAAVNGVRSVPTQKNLESFFRIHVEGGETQSSVLSQYAETIRSYLR